MDLKAASTVYGSFLSIDFPIFSKTYGVETRLKTSTEDIKKAFFDAAKVTVI